MPVADSSTEERTSSDEDQVWLETQHVGDTGEFWRRLLKDVGLGVIALLCLLSYVYWPHPLVVVTGVAVVVSMAWLSELRGCRSRLPIHNCSVLITGCDTGFGHALAIHLDRLGATVFAGCLTADGPGAMKLKKEGSDRMHVVQLDVTNVEQVVKCVQYVSTVTNGSGLWGLVNNAALNLLGDAELTTIDQYISQVNINQLGLVRVTKAFLPGIRQRKGRVVNVSSVKGLSVTPFCAAYTMTKYAVEAFSDTLRLEMKRFGVTVSIVEPGNYGGATDGLNMERITGDFESIWDNMSTEQRQIYGRQYIDRHIAFADTSRRTARMDISPVIHTMTDALFAVKPRARYMVHGGSSRIDLYCWVALISPFVPSWLKDQWLLSHLSAAFDLSQTNS